MPKTAAPAANEEQQALLQAAAAVLAPLARLAVAKGLTYSALDEALRRALVEAAAAALPPAPANRRVSRISTVTGLHRREVARLTTTAAAPVPHGRSLASEVFAHWTSDPDYVDSRGRPRVLPRQGPAPSFETLAAQVTRDVHPRSLLDELLRLNLASLDAAGERVTLSREGFVPGGDSPRLLALLGDNVGDHLAAAVSNVLAQGRGQLEQAVFADGLTDESLAALRELVTPLWTHLLQTLVPPLERMVEQGRAAPADVPRRRVRVGLYTYDDAAAPAPAPPAAPPLRRRRSPR